MYWTRIKELTNDMQPIFNPEIKGMIKIEWENQITFNPETEWMLKWEEFLWNNCPKYVVQQFRYTFN